MPSYDYRCPDGHTTTITRAITADELIPCCGKCGKPTARIHSAPAVAFRGTGWGRDPKPPRK